MSITYKSKAGDSFSIIARKELGNDTGGALIKSANPGIKEPIPVGSLLRIPSATDKNTQFNPSGLDIKVNNQSIKTFNNFILSKAIDAIRKCYFDIPNEEATRDIFKPLTPLDIEIGYNGSLIFTGKTNSPKPSGDILNIDCFSSCAIVEDSSPPLSAFPLEFKDSTLGGISKYLCNLMGVGFSFVQDSGARFTKTAIEQNETVLSYLAKLSGQRGFIISDNERGDLVFHKPLGLGDYVLTIDDTKQPESQVTITFDESQFYSSVTGFVKTKTGKEGASFTVENPFTGDLNKPYSFEVQEADTGELETVVNTQAGRMFAGALTVSLTVPTWTDVDGAILDCNKIITLKSPKNYIEFFNEFIIKTVSHSLNSQQLTTTLELTFTGAYSGEIPERLPWQWD